MMRFAALALAAALMAGAPLLVRATGCVLPPPDGADVEWSPPSMAGRILIVTPDLVVVRSDAGISYSVAVDDATDLFTAYGGGVDLAEIKPGQYADVWLKNCRPPGKTIARAAVIRVCSLAPEPCPAS